MGAVSQPRQEPLVRAVLVVHFEGDEQAPTESRRAEY